MLLKFVKGKKNSPPVAPKGDTIPLEVKFYVITKNNSYNVIGWLIANWSRGNLNVVMRRVALLVFAFLSPVKRHAAYLH